MAASAIPDYYGDGSLSAALYDLIEGVARPPVAEVAFYRRLAGPAPLSVLEIGCGTGRIAWPLAEAGHDVLGIDRSRAMLALAERRAARHPAEAAARIRFAEGDLRALDLGRRFDLLVLPYRVFDNLRTEEEQGRALAVVRAHLAPGGRAVLDTAHPTYEALTSPEAAMPRHLCLRLPEQGVVIDSVTVWTAIDLLAQTFALETRYTVSAIADGRVLRESTERLPLRWTNPPEMRHLVRLHGFTVLEEHQGFDGVPPHSHGDRAWVLGAA